MDVFVDVADSAAGTPQLRASQDLGALSIRVRSGAVDWGDLERALGAVAAGEVNDGQVWLDVAWLQTAAGGQDNQWYAAFAAMLDHADAHGWLSADRRWVRAHVDWGGTDED